MIYIDCIITEGGIIEAMMGGDSIIYADIIESGPQGPKGDSAYEHWLSLGNVGTINDFLLTLKGDKGDKGDPGDGSIVDLGTFDSLEQLITHVVMNQLPTGHYTFVINENEAPIFMLLERGQDGYHGTFHDSLADFYYFEVSFYGEIIELKSIDLRDLGDVRAYVDSKVQTDVPPGAKFTDTVYEHPATHPASMIEEENSRMFMTMTEKEELQGLLERETFVHTQIKATKEWIISHSLDKYPAVAVVDSAGSIVVGEVDYISKSIVRLRFTAEFSGKAYLN